MSLQEPIFRRILGSDANGVARPESARRAKEKKGSLMAAAESLSSRAYKHIRDEIINGRLHGGSIISEAAVAKTLGMSRTPVGDAIRQLVREGLVEQVPRFGTVVRELDRSELIELYEVREALESYAAGRAASHPDADAIARMEHLCDVIDNLAAAHADKGNEPVGPEMLRQFLAADMAFHLTVVQAAGNKRIADFVAMSRSISRIFKKRTVRHHLQHVVAAGEFHRQIAGAIKAGDSKRASELMLAHIQLSKQQALEGFDMDRARGSMQGFELPPEIQDELDQVERVMTRPEKRREK